MSSTQTTTVRSGGIGILGILGVVFVTLKLLGITEVATWSWWLVTAPLWGGAALVIGSMLLFGVGALLFALVILLAEMFADRKRRARRGN